MKVRLKNEIAELLGLTLKPKNKHGNARYYLSKEKQEELKYIKAEGILNSCDNLKVDPTNVKHLWKKTKKESLLIASLATLLVGHAKEEYNDSVYDPSDMKANMAGVLSGALVYSIFF